MRKEARLNLIFFGILLVLLAPGFLILMRKKLSGTDEPNYLPDPIPHSTAYNQPLPVPPGLPRNEPPEATEWVNSLVREHVSPTARMLRTGTNQPVVSDAFRTQAIHVHHDGAAGRVVLLVWDERPSLEPRVQVEVGAEPAGTSESKRTMIDVPKKVRHALQRVGYVDPPEKVWLVDLGFTASAMPERITVTTTDRNEKMTSETITLK